MSHTVEILSVGTELLLGNIVNLDAQILSQGLSALGLNVYWHTVVGDNPQRAREAVAAAKGRADIIITTGGLGEWPNWCPMVPIMKRLYERWKNCADPWNRYIDPGLLRCSL